jgi:hypothetical protein
MKKNILIIILIAFCGYVNAQNLVQNPYFHSDGAAGATSWTFTSTPTTATFVGSPGSWVPYGESYLAFYNNGSYNGWQPKQLLVLLTVFTH